MLVKNYVCVNIAVSQKFSSSVMHFAEVPEEFFGFYSNIFH